MDAEALVLAVPVARNVACWAVRLCRVSRPEEPHAETYVKNYVAWGAGPRACQNLILGAKARALFQGRTHVTTADIRYVAKPVLRPTRETALSYAWRAGRATAAVSASIIITMHWR